MMGVDFVPIDFELGFVGRGDPAVFQHEHN